MKKICMISFYSGKLPAYFNMWLLSASYCKNIDFLIVTSDKVKKLPPNVKILNVSLEDVRKLINKQLNINLKKLNPYKCADFKPMYGKILSEYLKDYEYWGHCDIDLMFGNLEKYLSIYEFEKFDKFSPLGHFSIYKNNTKNLNSYLLNGGKYSFSNVISINDNLFFDEYNGIISIYKCNNFNFFDNRLFADISINHHRFTLSSKGESKNYKNQIFTWESGEVYRYYYHKGCIFKDEFMYIHFQKRKIPLTKINDNNKYIICNKGFIPFKDKISIKDMKKYNKYRGVIFEHFEKMIVKTKYYFKRLIVRIKRILEVKHEKNNDSI